jgi:hypothetical protein
MRQWWPRLHPLKTHPIPGRTAAPVAEHNDSSAAIFMLSVNSLFVPNRTQT